jgi:hypothetical protein
MEEGKPGKAARAERRMADDFLREEPVVVNHSRSTRNRFPSWRNRFPSWRNRFLGSLKVYKYGQSTFESTAAGFTSFPAGGNFCKKSNYSSPSAVS